MPFKVRCRLAAFLGDAEKFPCGFGYKIGDEFIYDGEKFIGRICPYVLRGIIPHITAMFIAGDKYSERMMFRYTDRKEPDVEGAARVQAGLPPATERGRGWTFPCPDIKTLAYFIVEPIGLVEGTPLYKREMAMVEIIKAKPGLTAGEILNKLAEEESRKTSPRLLPTAMGVEIMLEELADAHYIKLRDGKAYPKSSSAGKASSE